MGTRARRIADHPLTRFALLAAAGFQALVGAFILGLSVKVGTTAVEQDGPPRTTPLVPFEGPEWPGETTVPGIGASPTTRPPMMVLPTKEILLPGPGGQVRSFTIAGDGTIWFTWSVPPEGGDRIGRLRTDGTFTAFPIPTKTANALGITMGPDGNIWFAEQGASRIGRMSPAGTFAEFPLPSRGYPTGIVTGPDGNLWFTVPTPDGKEWIGRITPAGAITRFDVPGQHAQPSDIIVGPDGNLWFSMGGGVGRITPQGVVTQLPAPTGYPEGVTVGPAREVWFVSYSPDKENFVGRAFATGPIPVVTQLIPLPAGAGAHGIVTARDGNVWVAQGLLQGFARITPAGQVTQYTLGIDRSPVTVRQAPDGTIWFSSTTRRGEAGGFGRFTVPS
jgi:streptogramin lyase